MIEHSFLVPKDFLLDPLQHIGIQFICIYFPGFTCNLRQLQTLLEK